MRLSVSVLSIFAISGAAAGTVMGLTGCASGTLGRLTGSDELPKELPLDQQQKFEIMEQGKASHALSAPSALIGPTFSDGRFTHPDFTGGRKKKSGKAQKQAEAESAKNPAAAPVFVYPSRRPPKEAIWVGEKLTYNISYFAVSAGEFVMEALPHKSIAGREVYHIRGNAVTSKVFNLFYRLNDMVETFIDFQGLFSHRFHIVLDETKQARDALELYDSEKAQTFYWNRWNHKERGFTETKEFAPVPRFAQDSVSVLYYLRSVPLPDGAVITVPVISEGKSWEAVVTVLRREERRTPMGRISTIVLKPETRYQGVLKKQGDSFLWLTDDDRRVPVRLEAKVKIGTVIAALSEFEPGTPPEEHAADGQAKDNLPAVAPSPVGAGP